MNISKRLLKDLYFRKEVLSSPDTVDSQLKVLFLASPLIMSLPHGHVYLENEDIDYMIDFLEKIKDRMEAT